VTDRPPGRSSGFDSRTRHLPADPNERNPLTTNTRDRSYRVQRELPVGTHVRLTLDTVSYTRIPAGTTGVVTGYSNAGFRGIEASIRLDAPLPRRTERLAALAAEDDFYSNFDPLMLHGVSAGILAAA
jgi:hypothetical protein